MNEKPTPEKAGFTKEDFGRIKESVTSRYARVSAGEWGKLFRYPIGREGLDGLGYDAELTAGLPDNVAGKYCGVANVLGAAEVKPGERVVDIGCGAGVDSIMAAKRAGPDGMAAGVELTPGMILWAVENAESAQAGNATFLNGTAQDLPFPDEYFDVAISNGVFNLVVDKAAALAEAWRVLKPGGRLVIADQVLSDESPRDKETMIRNWGR